MEFTTIAQGAHLEGLALQGNDLWYSEVLDAGGVHCIRADGRVSSWREGELWIGGLMVNEDGKLLISGAGGIKWLDPSTGRSDWLLAEINSKPIPGVNEMAADQQSGIVFGTVDIPAFETARAPGPSQLYRLSVDGKVTQLTGDLKFSNGLAFSADYSRLYHNESYVGTMAYDLDAGGNLSAPKALLTKADCDGLKIDVNGRLWICGFGSSDIVVLNPDDLTAEHFALPAQASTNLIFGGVDGRDVYITTVDSFHAGDPSEIENFANRKSTLIRMRSAVAGQALKPPKFCIG